MSSVTPTSTKPVPNKSTRKRHFRPSTRGSLSSIVSDPGKFTQLAPESPRPVELLAGIRADGVSLSHLDVACWEMVLSWTYDVDPAMSEREYKMPTSALRRFLGEFTKTAEVVDSINKLSDVKLAFGSADRLYSGVRMIETWQEFTKSDRFIAWSFPEPIRRLMSEMTAYAHVELAAVVDKKSSKYWLPIYKWLALQCRTLKWSPDEKNEYWFDITPDHLADVIDFPRSFDGSYNIGKLTAVVLDHHQDYEKVRRFKASAKVVRAPKRGRPVECYRFNVTVEPPSPQHVHAAFSPKSLREMSVGGVDDKRYVVQSATWVRAQAAFGRRPDMTKYGYLHGDFYKLWKVALSEALNASPLTAGYHTRKYRGRSLLDQMETEGAVYAAWAMITEETMKPDLLDYLAADTTRRVTVIARAECDRRERVGWNASGKRSRIESYYTRNKSSSVDPALKSEETEINKPVADWSVDLDASIDPIDTTHMEEAFQVQIPSFENCSEIHLSFKPVHLDFLESLFAQINSGPIGGKDVLVVSTYHDPEKGELDRWETEINVSLDDWCSILNKLERHLDGGEDYR